MNLDIIRNNRSVAQPGSALVWGASGHGFKSRHSDHSKQTVRNGGFFFILQTLIRVRMLICQNWSFLQIYELLKQNFL